MTRETAEQLLRTALNNPNATFRSGQYEAIDAVANHRKKLLVVQRTGWGKSLVYFIATRMLRDRGAGPTLIVSPLLALMRNQVAAAERIGIRAETINSTNQDQWDDITAKIINGETDVVLISPERLSNDKFIKEVLQPISGKIGLLTVDEAHCISDWGHDFRPDYRRLLNVIRQLPPNTPVLGTTATANDRVIADIQRQLGDIEVLRGPLVRESLALQAVVLPGQAERLAWLAQAIPTLEGTGIVYTLTKRDAEQVSEWLRKNGIDAQPYYSDVKLAGYADSHATRLHLENLLLTNEVKALVATTALGMGYDKPDIGFVIHYQAPGSVIGYYQQVGRAGRGLDRAYGVVLAGAEDDEIHDYFRRTAFPAEPHVQQVLGFLEGRDSATTRDIEAALNLRAGQIGKVLKYLVVESPAPVVKEGNYWSRTAVPYELDSGKIKRLTLQRESEREEIRAYLETQDCRMRFLQRALDDPSAEACGKCDTCVGAPLIPNDLDHRLVVEATKFLRHSELPISCKKQVAANAFQVYGFTGSLPKDLRAEQGRVLARWGDAGWGRMVVDDKHQGHFRDELVDAMVDMIQSRWVPEPAPQWVANVPSHRSPDPVRGLAERLAERLGLRYVHAIVKIAENEPQKAQENRFHQCHNLDGVFQVVEGIPSDPVLLVDDIFDSGWTMTVLAALLRQAGSGPVFPVVLASTTSGA